MRPRLVPIVGIVAMMTVAAGCMQPELRVTGQNSTDSEVFLTVVVRTQGGSEVLNVSGVIAAHDLVVLEEGQEVSSGAYEVEAWTADLRAQEALDVSESVRGLDITVHEDRLEIATRVT